MRPLRIISLLFSLGQFLLILKLIELVRGTPTLSPNLSPTPNLPLSPYSKDFSPKLRNLSPKSPTEENLSQDLPALSPKLRNLSPNSPTEQDLSPNSPNLPGDESRSFFITANSKKKQKKYKLWTDSTDITTADYSQLEFEQESSQENSTVNSTALDRLDLNVADDNFQNFQNFQNFENSTLEFGGDGSGSEEGRLCPGCESGTCGANPHAYGFPVIPVIIAIIVGIAWFFVFLFLWYYAIVPPKMHSSGGYGYGHESNSGWSQESSSSGLSSIFSWFGGDGRSMENLQNFNQLSSLVGNTLSTLSKIYA